MKKQIALALAGTAAAVAGGFRLVQELVERSDRHESGASFYPEDESRPTAPAPFSSSTGSTAGRPADPAPTKADPKPGKAADDASKAELYEIAATLKISGRSKMSKAELREAINAAS